jgi:hypothetical protein
VSFGNVVGSDNVTSVASINSPVYSSSHNLDAGSYTQTASTLSGTDASNYTFGGYTTATNNYTVGKLGLTGTITTGNSVYGSPLNPGVVSFTNEVSGDVLDTATVGVNTAGNTSTSGHLKAGSYTGIESVSGLLSGADAGNYSFAGLSGNYTVSLAPLIYTATPVTIIKGQSIPSLTGSVNGFVAGDNLANSTTGTVTWSSNVAPSSPVGQYYVDGSGLNSVNYSFGQAIGNAHALTLVTSAPLPPPLLIILPESLRVDALMDANILPSQDETPLFIVPSSTMMEAGDLGLPLNSLFHAWTTSERTIWIEVPERTIWIVPGKNNGPSVLHILNGGLKLPGNVVGLN